MICRARAGGRPPAHARAKLFPGVFLFDPYGRYVLRQVLAFFAIVGVRLGCDYYSAARSSRGRGASPPHPPPCGAPVNRAPSIEGRGAPVRPARLARCVRPAPRYGSGSSLRYWCFSCLLARVGPPSRDSSARAIAVSVQWGTHHCCEAFFFISLRRCVLCHRRILGTFAPCVWSFRAFRGDPA